MDKTVFKIELQPAWRERKQKSKATNGDKYKEAREILL